MYIPLSAAAAPCMITTSTKVGLLFSVMRIYCTGAKKKKNTPKRLTSHSSPCLPFTPCRIPEKLLGEMQLLFQPSSCMRRSLEACALFECFSCINIAHVPPSWFLPLWTMR